jgi:hypothetical protein
MDVRDSTVNINNPRIANRTIVISAVLGHAVYTGILYIYIYYEEAVPVLVVGCTRTGTISRVVLPQAILQYHIVKVQDKKIVLPFCRIKYEVP